MTKILTLILGIIFVTTPMIARASGSLSPWAGDALRLMNNDRRTNGLAPLIQNPLLEGAAQAKLEDMEKAKYFAHTAPSGATPWDFIGAAGYEYRFAGENLAIHYSNPDAEHMAWMQSELHCQNILDPRFHDIGIAVKKVFFEGRDTILIVAMFGTDPAHVTATSKDTAVSLCRMSASAVSGTSVMHQNQVENGVVGFLSRVGIPKNRIHLGEVAALGFFALSELFAVLAVSLALLRREWRHGVV